MNINTLYKEALDGNSESINILFSELSERFQMFVQNRVWDKNDIEDLVQDSLMTIHEKYKDLKSDRDFTAWSYKVLKNKLLYYFRTKKYQSQRESDEINGSDPPAPWFSDPLMEIQIKKCLKKISQAKVHYIQLLDLHYQGYTVVEICKKLKLTTNALYITLSRARSLLKLCLDKGDIS